MTNGGSIPMFFEATDRLQPLILPPDHNFTHFDHALLWASMIFGQKYKNPISVLLWEMGTPFLHILRRQIDCNC